MSAPSGADPLRDLLSGGGAGRIRRLREAAR